MGIARYILILAILVPSLLMGQERRSIHQRELEAHRGVVVNYARIDSLAALIPLPVRKALRPYREVIGYLPFWKYGEYENLNYSLLTQINYFSAELDASGNIDTLNGWPRPDLVAFAHARGVKVKLCANLFGDDDLTTLLSSSANRQRAIDNLLASVKAAGADGVDIDFELMPASQRANLVTFMTDLTDAFHTQIPGSIVTMATPAVGGDAWDYGALAEIVDGLFIMAYDYHWKRSETAGPVSPLDGFSRDVSWSVSDYLSKTGNNSSKIILGLPYYGIDWPVANADKYAATTAAGSSKVYITAYAEAATNGRQWDGASSSPWYQYEDTQHHQGWYDDSLSLSMKYQLALDNNLAGVGMWALGYDGDRRELWGALAAKFSDIVAPDKPEPIVAINRGDGTIHILMPKVDDAVHTLYASDDGIIFQPVDSSNIHIFSDAGLEMNTLRYYRGVSGNIAGDSPMSEVVASISRGDNSRILIVNGFDRTDGITNTFDYIRQYGPLFHNLGYAIDGVSNEAVTKDWVTLTDYAAVFWIAGAEGTADSTFTPAEQTLVADYLESGGNLFVSGSEIGYDLSAMGSVEDSAFYNSYFKADFVADNATLGGYAMTAIDSALFDSLGTVNFDDGLSGTYNVEWPDGISPIGGALPVLTYDNIDPLARGYAGLSYEGSFGQSASVGRLVYLGIGLETVYPDWVRETLISRVLDFFQLKPDAQEPNYDDPDQLLGVNYPNPFANYTHIPYRVPTDQFVELLLYNIRGQLVKTMVSAQRPANDYEYILHPYNQQGHKLASGIYLVVMKTTDYPAESKKITLIK